MRDRGRAAYRVRRCGAAELPPVAELELEHQRLRRIEEAVPPLHEPQLLAADEDHPGRRGAVDEVGERREVRPAVPHSDRPGDRQLQPVEAEHLGAVGPQQPHEAPAAPGPVELDDLTLHLVLQRRELLALGLVLEARSDVAHRVAQLDLPAVRRRRVRLVPWIGPRVDAQHRLLERVGGQRAELGVRRQRSEGRVSCGACRHGRIPSIGRFGPGAG